MTSYKTKHKKKRKKRKRSLDNVGKLEAFKRIMRKKPN
jgi:hypothetical protein